MTKIDTSDSEALRAVIEADLQDTLDEELEMELDDSRLEELEALKSVQEPSEAIDRSLYFKELLASW